MSPRRTMWFAIGTVALTLGFIGIALPVLPTTPFVLLAAFAFGKSAPAISNWLETSQTFGPIIADWRDRGAIAPRFKILAISMMAGVLLLSVALSAAVIVLFVQAVCMAGAAAFILSRPSS